MTDQKVAQFLAKKHLALCICFDLLGNGGITTISLQAVVIAVSTLKPSIQEIDVASAIHSCQDLILEDGWVTLN